MLIFASSLPPKSVDPNGQFMLTDPVSVPVQTLGRLNSVRSLSPVHESNVHSATTLSPEMSTLHIFTFQKLNKLLAFSFGFCLKSIAPYVD